MMRRRTILALLLGLALILSTQPILANPPFQAATVRNPATDQPVRTVTVPETAVQHSPALVPLGSASDNGRIVEGYLIIHYKEGFNHKPGHDKGGPGGGQAVKCFQFLSQGARWKTTEPYVLDPTNSDGLGAAFVRGVIETSFETWDTQVAFDIFGPENTTATVDGPDTVAPDNKNEILFGTITESGAIAVAIVWGIFSGPPSGREIVEYDIVFDDPDFTWGDATLNPAVMDFQNIATHEIGHPGGLADLYEMACSEETMFGFASNGETKKRTLNAGDIAGIKKLYE